MKSDANTSETQAATVPDEKALKRERHEVLQRLEDWLETPMLVLAFVWLVLLVVELTWGEGVWFEIIGTLVSPGAKVRVPVLAT